MKEWVDFDFNMKSGRELLTLKTIILAVFTRVQAGIMC